MAAFRRAVELGARFIETDLRLTRDARFVALHDPTLERTTNGQGRVRNLTLAELRGLDSGSWFGPEFAGERIPALEEVLHFANQFDLVLYLELKPEVPWGVQHALVGMLRGTDQLARAVILSFDPPTLAAIRRIEPTLMTGLLFERPQADIVEAAVRVGARQLGPRQDLVTRELVERAHRSDLQLVTWTVDEPEEMRALVSLGVNGIMTNYPDRLVAVLGERQFRQA